MNHFHTLYAGFLSLLLWGLSLTAAGAPAENFHFNVIPLGTSGGEFQNNLSAYLVVPKGSKHWVALDAGSLCSAIYMLPMQELEKLQITSKDAFFTTQIKAYLISHAHLDHTNGLVICSTIDSNKEIMGLAPTINYIRDNLFNWKIWPNFGDDGQAPLLKKYHYHPLQVGKNTHIPQTDVSVTAYPLNHNVV